MEESMIQAAIFDIDGTLLDTERIYVRAWQIAAREMGYEIPDDLMRRTRAISAKAAAEILEREIGNGFSYAKVRVHRHEIAEEMLDRESPVLKSGALEMLDALRARNIKIAAATSTNAAQTERHLQLNGLLTRLPVHITGDMVERGKPFPDIFLKAAEAVQTDPARCLAVEDSPAGAAAASAAGMRVLLVPDIAIITQETIDQCFMVCKSLTEALPKLDMLLA